MATFRFINGVTIKGGYTGFGEPDPDARDIAQYKTILSGDLNGDDGPDFANNSENSYHVVTGSGTDGTAALDGFTITGGNADGPLPDDRGGGMYNNPGSPIVINCTFSGNSARQHGGGMDNSDSHPRLTNCTFIGNRAELKYGGGIRNYNSTPTLINCIFSGNSGESQAGGMFNHNHSNANLINCTFSTNTAAAGGGIRNALESNPTLTNCILWGNTSAGQANEPAQIGGGTPRINYSCIQGWAGSLGGTGNHGLDPLFVDADGADDLIGTEDDNLRLLPDSPCIDAGDNSAVPPSVVVDLDGNPRIAEGTVDMGAYERIPTPNIYYVDAVNGDNNNDGLTLETAFATIQKGIDAAVDGEVVLVYPGLYQEEVNFTGKALTVQGIVEGPAGVPVLQNPGDFAVSFYHGEGPDSILKNFIIKNSFMGVFIAGSYPTIKNLTIVGNKYGIEAYALPHVFSGPDIRNSIIWNNTDGDLFGCRPDTDLFGCLARYSCIGQVHLSRGNIDADPLFVDPDNGDYHLRSERGRYWPEHDIWVLDEVTSPCVDGGDPGADPSDEPMPNGNRINMGAYGGTPQASLSLSCQPPGQASNPRPADGAVEVDRNVILSWTAGRDAVSHDVSFGTENPPALVGSQTTTEFDPGTLSDDTTYFWRIDEIDSEGKTVAGAVWSFTTMRPPKGRTCFTGETGVWVDGALVPISKVAPGRNVACIDSAGVSGSSIRPLGGVEELQEHEGTFVCYDILLESGNRISVAENHYFLTESGRWVSLQKLTTQTRLRTLKGSIGIISVTRRPVPYVGKVYNLKIEGSHRYPVGKDAVIVRDH
jgi:hypothetical protein